MFAGNSLRRTVGKFGAAAASVDSRRSSQPFVRGDEFVRSFSKHSVCGAEVAAAIERYGVAGFVLQRSASPGARSISVRSSTTNATVPPEACGLRMVTPQAGVGGQRIAANHRTCDGLGCGSRAVEVVARPATASAFECWRAAAQARPAYGRRHVNGRRWSDIDVIDVRSIVPACAVAAVPVRMVMMVVVAAVSLAVAEVKRPLRMARVDAGIRRAEADDQREEQLAIHGDPVPKEEAERIGIVSIDWACRATIVSRRSETRPLANMRERRALRSAGTSCAIDSASRRYALRK